MAIETKHVVVIQDASKLNFKVFSWVINGLSLKEGDMVTLLAILHEVYNPMGYKSKMDNNGLVGVNQRIIEGELARKKEEYLNHEELAKIAKVYDSNEVAFKIQLYAGSSPKHFAIEGALNLKATWVILDRQMKKDEEFFTQKLSCGISRILGKNHIERIRGPIDLAVEIQCNSHETYPESLPESPREDVSNDRPINVEETSQINFRPDKDEGCSTIIPSMDETDISSNKIIDKDAEHIEKMAYEDDIDTTHMTNNDQTKDLPMSQDQRKNASACSICSVCKTRRPNIEWLKEFTYEEVEAATDGFSLKNCLSESGNPFSTFKGKLEGELKIVVKQHEITNIQVREKMISEVQTIVKARHNNVVMLLGSSTKDRFMLIVYEYACNGSLDMYLSRESCKKLTWSERLRVAIGLSRGLKYLHDNNIIHGNIKPSNILLAHDLKPLLGDFDLGKKLEPKKSFNNKSIGNSEYTAPEYQEKGKLSTKTDVYSFGVVILELITGRKATDKISGEKRLVGWAKPLLGGKKYSELVDPIISNTYEEDQLRWLVKVTAQCLKKKPKERLSMNMVVSALQGIVDSEQSNITEDLTLATSDSRIGSDIDGSQVTLQGITDRKQCNMTEDIPQVVSNSRELDLLSPKAEQIERISLEEESCLRIKVEDNQFYTTGQKSSDILSQIDEQMQNMPQRLDLGNMIINQHMMDQTIAAEMSDSEQNLKSNHNENGVLAQKISNNRVIGHDQEDETSFVQMKRGLQPVPISGIVLQTQLQTSFTESLRDKNQDGIILEKSKSSACSICKSKRPKIVRMKDFTCDELVEATKGFSVENSLSESEDGPTFKGLLENKVKIVVKKHQMTRSQEEKTFKSEVQLFTKVRHKNVVMLLGLCTDESQLMIVYEQVCNGSLDHYLSRGNFQSLTWKERMKISIGTGRGLKYLHENKIIHGSIKASNILLTHDFEPLIGDFGFGKVKLEPKKSYKDKSGRDFGYAAPEYLENGKLSTKTDVYSFGVVLLELITGRRAMDKLQGGKNLVGWAKPLLGGKKYPQLVDSKISNTYEEEQLQWLVQVTEKCLKKNPKERYSMNMVVSALQGITESDDCCLIEDSSSSEKSYLPNDEPVIPMTNSHGHTMADPVSWEAEPLGRNTCNAETSFITAITTNNMIEQIKENQHKKESFHIEENDIEKKEVNKQQKINLDEKVIQDSYENEGLLSENQGETILESISKSSVCSICKSRRPNNEWQRKFTYEEIQAATEGFSIKYSLSEGAYGPAFKVQLDDKMKVAIKKIQVSSLQEEKVFVSEIQLLANTRHENIIMLLGSCIRQNQLLIVYEYSCNGSLDHYLSSKSGRLLTWRERMKIATGVSRGLKFLHENNIIHGRVKPSNILLNHDYKPLVGDFVFPKERRESKNSCKDKRVRNCGYIAPECKESGKVSTKADVYSFGVILLELITGCMVSDKIQGQKCLVEWARPLLGGKEYLELMDPEISSSYDEEELASLVLVSEKCLRKNPKERFTMNMVVSLMPSVVDINDINAIEDSSSEKSDELYCVSDVRSSEIEEVGEEEGLGRSEERENNIRCSNGNCMETKEKERCESYGGARHFFLDGGKEYIACEELFSLCNSI
ncbi:uncharacterized protein LOC131662540 [Vicia villosa]|uniref:uncharacterized protein LOC131662540 n=1 Tax=Vicia villosa TaxID=3911 RepID=UPI00273B0BA9|nr:uncharacterized protein LOC131662540 [Vicia villosa]